MSKKQRAESVKVKFNQGYLEGLKPPEQGRKIVWDRSREGLGITVYPNGRKVFHWQRFCGTKPIFISLVPDFPKMSLEDARIAAAAKNTLRDEWKKVKYTGPNPFEHQKPEPAPVEQTFGGLVESYITLHTRQHAKRPAEAEKNTRWIIGKYLPGWEAKPVSVITSQVVAARHLEMSGTPRIANQTAKLVRTIFNFAIDQGTLPIHAQPVRKKFHFFKENKRKRFLSKPELARLHDALERSGNRDLLDFVMLAVFCGARKRDILSMRWQDIDWERRCWEVPNPKGEPYTVWLSKQALAVLKERPRIENDPWVFPSATSECGHLRDLKIGWDKALKAAGLYSRDQHLKITQHDLRRTLGSHLAMAGVPLPAIARALGHAPNSAATFVYARVSDQSVQQAVADSNEVMGEAMGRLPAAKAAGE